MKAFLLSFLLLPSAHAADDAACQAKALAAVTAVFGTVSESHVRTIAAGKRFEVSVQAEGDEETNYDVTFPKGCDQKPEVSELSDDAESSAAVSHSHFGNRCLEGEEYRDGQCCKRGKECPPAKPNPHAHDMKRR